MTADTVGGVWTYALELARALQPHSVTVDLATMGALPSPAQEAEAAAVPRLTLHSSAFALEWMPDPWEDAARAGNWLMELERALRPDVVHLNGYVHAALPFVAPTLTVGHSCVLSWWRAVKGADAPPEWARYADAVRAGLRASDCIVAPTRAMLDCLQAHYGPFARAQVIPNGRAAARFPPGTKQPFVFSAGRVWDEAKNVETLARAARKVSWPVVVAGDAGGSATEFENVRLLGRLTPSQVADWLGQASIYALPARYEPFGLSALEAALAGCALVLGDIPSLREVWGDAALFAPPNNADALARDLQSLIDEPPLRAQMAARARVRALPFTPERMADGYLQRYRALAARKELACA